MMSLEVDLTRLARAVDNVLLAGHGQAHWLKPPFPPFRSAETGDRGQDQTDLLANAVAHYGGPCAGLDLWIVCRAIDELSRAWTGKGLDVPVMVTPAPESLPESLDNDGGGSAPPPNLPTPALTAGQVPPIEAKGSYDAPWYV